MAHIYRAMLQEIVVDTALHSKGRRLHKSGWIMHHVLPSEVIGSAL